ncbi:Spindle assembly abnormal protein 6 [Heracleum sosnowskyi]|uniref:Spindle assembly abnormal protein 6 n=1 Tax=Heracleum sosnowskyi TaxID=360622 RepID=A0AAD8J4K3_9APIA|nr:Spindle assembly abnormal protein 6 [Heracleum sosnowskyi]
MRTMCTNFDRKDGLETVLEVPMPEEVFASMGSNAYLRWQNIRCKMRAQLEGDQTSNDLFLMMLKIVSAPVIPYQPPFFHPHLPLASVKDGSFQAATAKYIVQQYIAATGGQAALDAINSMCAVGQVSMASSPIQVGDAEDEDGPNTSDSGGFVLWQMDPDFWYLELVVSSCKISAGSDGKIGWSQSSNSSIATRGPPRPLRRFYQGLDPRSIVNIFFKAMCLGEKTTNDEECFILKHETNKEVLMAQKTENTDVVHHTIWGYFSQRTGLLIKFEDTKLVKMNAAKKDDHVFWETSMESVLEDYRVVDGINVAHSGRTTGTLFRYGQGQNHKAKIEETWKIEDVDFNVRGLTTDCFLPPAEAVADSELQNN